MVYSDPKFENGSLDFNDGAACALIPSCAANRLVTRNGQQAMNLQGLKSPFASDWTFNTDAQYDHQLGFANLTGFARVDYRYESKQYNTVTYFAFYGPRELVNLHIGVRRDDWVLTLFVLNATNNLTPVTNQANGQ
jgi:outer membrane receptor protein involved in Fe transport